MTRNSDCNPVLNQQSDTTSLLSLFLTFLKIGSTAFGGFMALISVVQNYTVERHKLLRHEDILNATSIATILPGPVAMNVVAYVGYRLRGIPGAIITTTAVTLPSFLLLLFLTYAYFHWGNIPAVEKFFMGFIPAVAAIIVAAAWNMGKKTLQGPREFVLFAAAFALLMGVGGFFTTLAIIAMSGLLGFLLFRPRAPKSADNPENGKANENQADKGQAADAHVLPDKGKLYSSAVAPIVVGMAPILSVDMMAVFKLFSTFAAMSVLLFGGGFVFIPLMQESVVEVYGWVTPQEFVDAIALGQVTPGPILISATFIGFKVAGLLGAIAATIGIFTPPAMLMLFCAHHFERMKDSLNLQAVMRGIRSAVIGLIAAAAVVIAQTAEANIFSLIIFAVALLALLRLRVEVAFIIPAAGLSALLFY